MEVRYWLENQSLRSLDVKHAVKWNRRWKWLIFRYLSATNMIFGELCLRRPQSTATDLTCIEMWLFCLLQYFGYLERTQIWYRSDWVSDNVAEALCTGVETMACWPCRVLVAAMDPIRSYMMMRYSLDVVRCFVTCITLHASSMSYYKWICSRAPCWPLSTCFFFNLCYSDLPKCWVTSPAGFSDVNHSLMRQARFLIACLIKRYLCFAT